MGGGSVNIRGVEGINILVTQSVNVGGFSGGWWLSPVRGGGKGSSWLGLGPPPPSSYAPAAAAARPVRPRAPELGGEKQAAAVAAWLDWQRMRRGA